MQRSSEKALAYPGPITRSPARSCRGGARCHIRPVQLFGLVKLQHLGFQLRVFSASRWICTVKDTALVLDQTHSGNAIQRDDELR